MLLNNNLVNIFLWHYGKPMLNEVKVKLSNSHDCVIFITIFLLTFLMQIFYYIMVFCNILKRYLFNMSNFQVLLMIIFLPKIFFNQLKFEMKKIIGVEIIVWKWTIYSYINTFEEGPIGFCTIQLFLAVCISLYNMYVCMYVSMNVCMYVCMYVCVCV
jgi:hypothetical protein